MVTRPRLRRRTQHRLVSGVAGGIADRLNAPVGFVRFAIWFASIYGPWVLWGYALATIAIPADGRDRPDWDTLVGLARLGLVSLVPLVVFQGEVAVNAPFGGPVGWFVAYYGLFAAGAVALLGADYWRGRSRTPTETRSVVLAAMPVVACGVAIAGAMLIAPDVRLERWVPLAAIAGGAALLVAAWRERHDGFTTPAIVALALAAAVIAADARLEGGVGDSRMTPTPDGDGRVVARRAIGDLVLDLRHVARDQRPVTVEASVGVGSLEVHLPARLRVQIDARVGQGTLEPTLAPDFETHQGFDQRVDKTYGATRHPDVAAPIRLEARVGLGKLSIERGPTVLKDAS